MRQRLDAARACGEPRCWIARCNGGNDASVLIEQRKAAFQIKHRGKAGILQVERNMQRLAAAKIAVQRDLQRTQTVAQMVVDKFKRRALKRLAVLILEPERVERNLVLGEPLLRDRLGLPVEHAVIARAGRRPCGVLLLDEAMVEADLDIEEGADIIMVKPALSYLDIIRRFKDNYDLPIAAYNVSGEYSMLKQAVKQGLLSEDAIYEAVMSIKRAGATIIITYFAKDLAKVIDMKK